MSGSGSLTDSALEIWRSGVEAVLPDKLIENRLTLDMAPDGNAAITVAGEKFHLSPEDRVFVVGMGKAGGAMAVGLESALAPLISSGRLSGWINVPADVVRPLRSIHLHAGRPAGLNEPTVAGVAGSLEMSRLIRSAGPGDLILALISGGGSALAPLPVPEITLEEKALVTRLLSGAGANIVQLNTVRKRLSQIKGGGMRRMARGKRLVSLILSDVLGDSLNVIASGATVPDSTTAADALAVLREFELSGRADLKNVVAALKKQTAAPFSETLSGPGYENHRNVIVANNRTAVDAACRRAEKLGFRAIGHSASESEGDVRAVAEELIEKMNRTVMGGTGLFAHISGGEPTVTLAPPEIRGRGGRNTQLVLLALLQFLKDRPRFPARFAFLSGGTDGEDGPTDAAGAFFGEEFPRQKMVSAAAQEAARRNDSYSFFEKYRGLLRCGATGTNVCDLRVLLFSADIAKENCSG